MTIASVIVATAAAVVAWLAWRASERTVKVQWLSQKEARLAALYAALESLKEPAAHYAEHCDDEREKERERERAEEIRRAEAEKRARQERSSRTLASALGMADYSHQMIPMPSPPTLQMPYVPPWSRSATLDGVDRTRAALAMVIDIPPDLAAEIRTVLDELAGEPIRADVGHLFDLAKAIEEKLHAQHQEAVHLVTPRRWQSASAAIRGRMSPRPVVRWARDRVMRWRK